MSLRACSRQRASLSPRFFDRFALLGAFLFLSTTAPLPHAAANPPNLPPKTEPAPLQKRILTYDIFFRGTKAGELIREEWMYPAGRTVVFNRSSFQASYFFFKMDGKNHSRCDYQGGQLVKFRAYANVRGKESTAWGHLNDKEVVIHRQEGQSKKTLTKTFPRSGFQATSLDFFTLPLKDAEPGRSLNRKMLRIDQQKIVDQEIRIVGAGTRKINGKEVSLLRLELKGPKGSGSVLLAKEGFMVETNVKSLMASFDMKLRSLRSL